MNARDKNNVSMYLSVIAVLSQHKELVDTVPALAEAMESFRSLVDEIIEQDSRHATITAGSTAAKNSALDKIIETALRLANALYAFGRKTDNEQLKDECDITKSDLKHRRQGEIEQYCNRTAELAHIYAADLEPYGITKEEIDSFVKESEAFRQAADSKDQKFTESKATRQAMIDTFSKAGDILKEDLDTMMEVLKEKNNDFYLQYRAARNIHDIGGGHATKNENPDSTETPEVDVAVTPEPEG